MGNAVVVGNKRCYYKTIDVIKENPPLSRGKKRAGYVGIQKRLSLRSKRLQSLIRDQAVVMFFIVQFRTFTVFQFLSVFA